MREMRLPLAAFLVGLLLTATVTLLLHRAERKALERDLHAEATEFFRHLDLLALNSILKMQAYAENTQGKILYQEVLRHTIFQRASIFKLIPGNDADGLPRLARLQMIENSGSTLRKPSPMMQSPTLRKGIGLMEKDGDYSRIVIHHDFGTEVLSAVLRASRNPKDFLVFSTPLRFLISEIRWKSESTILITEKNSQVKWLIQTWRDREAKITSNKAEVEAYLARGPRLLAEHVLSNSEVHFGWYFGPGTVFSGLTLIALGSGILISILIASLIYSLLVQNMRTADLVIARTRELAAALHDAQEANLAKTRFLANISHEVRTPLNLILGMLDMAGERSKDAKLNEYIKSMRAAGDHLLSLITDLLTMSQVDPVDPDLKSVPFESLAFFEEISRIIGPSARKKTLGFDLELDPDLPGAMKGDPARLRQIVMNLLRNSVKYTNRGFVRLRVRPLFSTPDSFRLIMEVSDSGVGIPKAHLTDIFNRFFQLESSRRFADGGVGLGLSIVKELVEKMHGSIRLNSVEGEGSTFTIEIPLIAAGRETWLDFYRPEKALRIFLNTRRQSLIRLAENLKEGSVIDFTLDQRNPGDGFQKVDLSGYDRVIVDAGYDLAPWNPSLLPADLSSFVILDSDERVPPAVKNRRPALIDDCPILPSNLLRALNYRHIPLSKPSEGEKKEEITETPAAPGLPEKLRLVIADDDDGNRYLMKSYLEDRGWDIEFAPDGQQALDACLRRKPDILIVDLRMPVLDGFQTADRLREFEVKNAGPRTPIILVTADALPETKREAESHQIDALLTKPLRKKHLLEAIANVRA